MIMHEYKARLEDGFMYVNLCPHAVDIKSKDGEIHHFAKCEEEGFIPPRVEEIEVDEEDEFTSRSIFEVNDCEDGKIINLPPQKCRVIIISSSAVATAAHRAGRVDVVSPGTLIRDDEGKPVGANGFKRHH